MSRVRIGTRGSALALWQANHVKERLSALGHEVELQVIVTTGDRLQERRLEAVGGKGAFLKEIEEAMLEGRVDLAVHSLKDVPTALPQGLALCAVLERADPRDVLLSRAGRLAQLPAGTLVGTTSLRRQAQIRALRPDLALADLRGNVETRIRRLHEGAFGAILLAMAGLARLGRTADVTEALNPRLIIPAPGQGAIALECRADDEAMRAAAAPLAHPPTVRAVTAERSFLAELGGGCNVPLGAHATAAGSEGKELALVGFVAAVDGSQLLRGEARGEDPAEVARALARDLIGQGAPALLAQAGR